MPVEIFTIEQFEAALPVPKKGPKFERLPGLHYNENVWVLYMPHADLRILVRSTIGASGKSDDTGQDSIRIYLQYSRLENGSRVWREIKGFKAPYTTRIKGWQDRLKVKIKQVSQQGAKVHHLLAENEAMKFSENPGFIGRPFAHIDGKFTRWLDDGTWSSKGG
jgi:hypothetical protein